MRIIEMAGGIKPDKGMGRVILILFFLSGFCMMIYLMAWMQGLRHFLGPPLLLIIGVLTIFLGGLAIGSNFTGHFIDNRPDPLKIYGLLEGALGIYSLILPLLIHWAAPIYKVIYQNIRSSFHISLLLRYLLCTLILLIPSILIGAVWPVIGRLLVQEIENPGRAMGRIYGINILGGSIGILAAGFVLLPHFGADSTIYFSACIDLIICISSLLLYKSIQSRRIVTEGPSTEKTNIRSIYTEGNRHGMIRRILLIGYGLSGLAAMTYQFIWLRVLAVFLDSYFPAISMILSAFLLGLALGSLCLAGLIDKRKDPLLLLGIIEMIVGLSFLGIIPLLIRYPIFTAPLITGFAGSFLLPRLIGFTLLFFIMFIPALLLGLSFPLACKILSDKIRVIGKSVSSVFSASASGCLLGTLSGGILLIIWPGIKRGSLVPVWSYIFIGYVFLLLSCYLSKKTKIAIFILIAGSFVIFSRFIPVWEMPLFREDPYLYSYHKVGYQIENGADHNMIEVSSKKKEELLFSKEGIINVVSVIKAKEDISMQVNGRLECSTKKDLTAKVLAGHIPLLLHGQPKDILLIGIGSGITLGSIEHYPLREMECVEISKGMIEGSEYFNEFNNNALKDSRLRMIIEDAGHYLMFTDKKYDVIISQPLNAWPGAITDFFTSEFFRLSRQRLEPGGIAAIILPFRDIKGEVFRSTLVKWHKVFPFMNLWETNLGTDYLMIGSNERLKWDYPLIKKLLDKTEIASDLARVNIKDPPLELLTFYSMNNQGLTSTCLPGRIFPDYDTQKAFFALRLTYGDTIEYPLEDIQQNRGKGLNDLLTNLQGLDESEIKNIKEKIHKAIEARRLLTKAYIHLIKNESRDKVLEGLKEALRINPDDSKAIELYSYILFASAADYNEKRRFDLALWTLLELIRIMPDNIEAHYLLGKTYYNMGLIDQAVKEYEKVIEAKPDDEEVHCQLGIAYLNSGWIDLSISLFNRAIRINPDYADPHLYLGVAYFKKDILDDAIEEYKNAIVLGPDNADAHYNLGITYLKIGMIDEAISEWQEVIRIRPDDVNSRYNLAMAYYNHGDIDQSINQLEVAIKYKPDFSQARSLLEILYQVRKE